MRGFETRFRRLELKYVIDEPTAGRIRRDLEPYCREDPHNTPSPWGDRGSGPPGYLVRTLYLDTPSLAAHRAKQRGEPERTKLRIRGYSNGGFASLELKRRSSDVIDKTRVKVAADEIESASLGFGKALEDSTEARRFLAQFAHRVVATGAGPALIVRYWREAHASRIDAYARVTFDRRIAVQRIREWDHWGDPARWCEFEHHLSPRAPRPMVVLELKCEPLVPCWMIDLIQRYQLRRQSVSKYSLGIYMTGRRLGAADLARRCGEVMN